ncbi:MAG: N-acetylglucosamine-6-phosphate deacetylase [Eubacteriales bacterium]
MEKRKMLLKGHIISPIDSGEGKDILEIDGRSVTFIGPSGTLFPGSEHQIFDFGVNYICPGFINLHVHGSGGVDVMDNSYHALDWMSRALAEGGTTSFLATTMSAPRQELLEVVRTIANTGLRGTKGAQVIGAHLEGPFLNPGKKGAHKEEDLRPPDINEFKEYIDAGNGAVKMVTVAPELPDIIPVIKFARSRGVVVSLGHSVASIAQVDEAFAAGLSHVTHAFNAMGGLHHRDLGTTGAIMSMKQLTADVIPDGLHVHPSVIKILVQAKGIDRVCAITDCIRAGGMGNGIFEFGGRKVIVRDGAARLADGTISGSVISMAEAVKTIVEKVGLSLNEAVKMASANPAGILGLNSKGVLMPGKDADVVVLDRNFRVLMTIVAGKIVYQI